MCASTHWLASATAQSVLERGGNAFDAATAGAFVLHVAEPHLNGPGGDLVAVLATAADPAPRVLAGQGHAPRKATIEHFRAEGLDLVPGAGALAAAVPGAVDSWLWLLAELGTWELADVLAYAIDYAERGVPVVPPLARVLATVEELFGAHWPTSYALWTPAGRVPQPHDTLVNPVYARTLRRLIVAGAGTTRRARIDAARSTWRTGFVADALAESAAVPHRHSSGRDHSGVITAADFGDFVPSFEPAVTAEFRGVTVAKAGLWSQGPVLLQALTVLGHFDDDQIDPSTARGIHTITEVVKLAMADREAFYGHLDPVAAAVLHRLLAPRYSAERADLISDVASTEFRSGDIGVAPFTPPLVTAQDTARADGTGEPTVERTGESRGDTCHVDVVDRWGNLISATPSGGWLQSSPAVPELGFALGTRLQMTWLDPAAPSRLTPGRRPRTTLTPTLLLRLVLAAHLAAGRVGDRGTSGRVDRRSAARTRPRRDRLRALEPGQAVGRDARPGRRRSPGCGQSARRPGLRGRAMNGHRTAQHDTARRRERFAAAPSGARTGRRARGTADHPLAQRHHEGRP